MEQTKSSAKKWYFLVAGIILGALAILTIRFFSYSHPHTHYHANFAVYINGKREEFKDARYYQEVAVCSSYEAMQPAKRAHMHDNVNSVVHVHDEATTWSQFFENIGWSIGSDFIQNDSGSMYKEDDTNKLNIVLNGENVTGFTHVQNIVINDEDRLLISYGNIDKDSLQNEYKSVAATAHDFDVKQDPASCSGHENPSVSDRLKHLF